MRYFKTRWTVSLVVLTLLGLFVGFAAPASQTSNQPSQLDQLLNDIYWAKTIYDGWLESKSDLSLEALIGEDSASGGISSEELVLFYKDYEKEAQKLYKQLSASSKAGLELTLAVALYRSALLDMIEVAKKDKFTKKNMKIMKEAYDSLYIVGDRVYSLTKNLNVNSFLLS